METINLNPKGSFNLSGDKITITRAEKKSKWSYLNLDYLEKIAPGNKEFSKTMLNLFRENSKTYLQRMEDQIQKKDFDSLAKTAHAMKPTGSYIGVESLTPMIAELEMKAKEHSEDAGTLLTKINLLITDVTLEINEFLSVAA